MIAVRLAALDAAGDLPTRHWEGLTEAERQRASRFRRDSDRAQFVAARGLLRDALRELFGVTGATLVADGGGKPRLVGVAIPPDLDVNLSHADGLAACVLGLDVRVGIDVERRDRPIDAAATTARHFAAEEQHARDTPAFLRLWTLKEAVAKAVGLGLALDLSEFACADDPPRLLRGPPALGSLAQWELRGWEEPAHLVAVAVQRPLSRAPAPPDARPWTPAARPPPC